MKKVWFIIFAILLIAVSTSEAWDDGWSSGGVETSTECNASKYYKDGTLCQDTDDNKLYLGTGAAILQILSATSIGTIATQNADNVTITDGNIAGNVTVGSGKTLDAQAGTTTLGTTNVGSTTAGKNLAVNATRTSIFTFDEANINEDDATWTQTGTGPLVHVTGNTTAVTATTTEAIVAGTTYKVTITGTGGGGTAAYTLGGVTGTTIAASGAIAIEDYITASTTGDLIITPASACTVSITNITIQKQTDATGDATVDGDLFVRSSMTIGKRLSFFGGAYTPYLEANSSALKMSSGAGTAVLSNAIFTVEHNSGAFGLGTSNDVRLYRDDANIFAQRRSTNQQSYRIYNTYTDSSNYERLSLTGVQGASVNLTAETAGTGGDNLDIVLTPAGTGAVKTMNIQPIADDTYYLGKNDDDTPLAFKGAILKDTTNGKYYRIEVINGTITATDLTD